MNMKILMVIAVLILIGGFATADVILAALAVSSLCFAVAAVLATRSPSINPACAKD